MTFDRRAFLRGTAGALLTLPVMESLAPRRALAAAGPRFIAFTTVLGTFPEKFWPRAPGSPAWAPDYRPQRQYATGATAADNKEFQLEPITAPLARHKSDLLFVEGLDRLNCEGHGGYCNMLTGKDADKLGEEKGWGPSLDQILANRIGASNKFPSLQIGVHNSGTGKYECLSWYDAGKPAPAESDPAKLFARIFAEVPAPGGDGGAFEALRARRRSVLDAALGQAKSLEARLGQVDRHKLAGYMDSVRQIEQRLTRIESAVACSKPPAPVARTGSAGKAYALIPEITTTQIELLAVAMACDLTRVATFQIGTEGSNIVHTWLDVAMMHHDLSHTKPDDPMYVRNYDWITKIGAWHAQQLATLIDKLKGIDGGALWNDTLILWLNGLTWGCFHEDARLPVMLAGSAGGQFRTGRHVRLERKTDGNATTNDLFAQILKAHGVEPASFGDAGLNRRPLDLLRG